MDAVSLAPTQAPEIMPRNIDFALDPTRVADWLDGSPEKTVFWNAQSALFPVGERFFIHSVVQYRDLIDDPLLKAQVKAFVQQEGFHTREHIAYNEALRTLIAPEELEADVEATVAFVKKRLPRLASLLATCALEHYTAFLAKSVLENPEFMRGAEPGYDRLWRWHALEEIEHKAVAFDVFRTVTKARGRNRELNRALSLPLSIVIFLPLFFRVVYKLMKAQGLHRKPASWAKFAWYAFGYPGMFRRFGPAIVQYAAPSFHPNDIDDRETIAATRTLVATYA
jgi:predicted metal-dependent hydrolase